jgi:hypothetical protein
MRCDMKQVQAGNCIYVEHSELFNLPLMKALLLAAGGYGCHHTHEQVTAIVINRLLHEIQSTVVGVAEGSVCSVAM